MSDSGFVSFFHLKTLYAYVCHPFQFISVLVEWSGKIWSSISILSLSLSIYLATMWPITRHGKFVGNNPMMDDYSHVPHVDPFIPEDRIKNNSKLGKTKMNEHQGVNKNNTFYSFNWISSRVSKRGHLNWQKKTKIDLWMSSFSSLFYFTLFRLESNPLKLLFIFCPMIVLNEIVGLCPTQWLFPNSHVVNADEYPFQREHLVHGLAVDTSPNKFHHLTTSRGPCAVGAFDFFRWRAPNRTLFILFLHLTDWMTVRHLVAAVSWSWGMFLARFRWIESKTDGPGSQWLLKCSWNVQNNLQMNSSNATFQMSILIP